MIGGEAPINKVRHTVELAYSDVFPSLKTYVFRDFLRRLFRDIAKQATPPNLAEQATRKTQKDLENMHVSGKEIRHYMLFHSMADNIYRGLIFSRDPSTYF